MDKFPTLPPADDDAEAADEELEDVPAAEKDQDPLFGVEVKRKCNGQEYLAYVEDIEVGKVTRERLYRIRYPDDDLEHLTAEQVRNCLTNKTGDALRRKPAAAGKLATEESEALSRKKPAAAAQEALKRPASMAETKKAARKKDDKDQKEKEGRKGKNKAAMKKAVAMKTVAMKKAVAMKTATMKKAVAMKTKKRATPPAMKTAMKSKPKVKSKVMKKTKAR